MSLQPLQPGAHLGKYEVLAHVATGGMGIVYKARDLELGRLVALKVLSSEVGGHPNLVERFRREARHAARLRHKNIVTLYEFGQADGHWYLAMEFVEGIDLDTYAVRKGQLSPEEVRRFLKQAARALDHAYRMGITHRDIKPANFLLTREEGHPVVKLTDFGLAQAEDENQSRLTRDGSTVGTVDYLSPEQARDSSTADIRSDIYSLGCTCYHLLAGHPPFPEGGLGERIYKHMQAEPPDLRLLNPRVPDSLWVVLSTMLAKKAEDRYQTPAELLEALDAAKRGISLARPGRPADPTSATSSPSRPRPAGAGTPLPARSDPTPAETTPARPDRSSAPSLPVLPPDADAGSLLGLSAEQLQIAAGQFDRACQARDGGSEEYALELLLGCCQLDPGNVFYRQTLRQVSRSLTERGGRQHRPSALAALATWARFKAARHRRDYQKILEYGEGLLLRNPRNVGTQTEMAAAAEGLGLISVAVWMLEQVREQEPENANVLRPLAGLYEHLRQFSRAIALWTLIRKVDPADGDALVKINALAASETIVRGGYRS
ncbi:MAG: protein kinase [Planctomycetes bacterium]|nr:protein kinase [Planctomycetota bacterium]